MNLTLRNIDIKFRSVSNDLNKHTETIFDITGFVSRVTDVTCVKCKNFTTVNTPQLSLANVTHPEFLSVFKFPRSPVVVVDCLLDDPVKWIALKVSDVSMPVYLHFLQIAKTYLQLALERKQNIS